MAYRLDRFHRLVERNPEHISGRQTYLKDVMGVAMDRQHAGKTLPLGFQRTIMKRHGARWKALPPQTQQRYSERVVIEISASKQALGSVLEEESQQLALLARRTEEAAQTVTSPPLLLSEARLNEVELAAFAAMYQSPSFGESVVWGFQGQG